MKEFMNTEELKKLAEDATPGPWSHEEIEPTDPEWGACEVFTSGSDDFIATHVTSVKNAAFISAANPAAILKLLAINAELLEGLRAITEGFSILKDSDFPALAKARAALAKAEGGEL